MDERATLRSHLETTASLTPRGAAVGEVIAGIAAASIDLAALIARVKAVPPLPGFSEIRIPGEQSAKNRARLAREGLDIDRLVFDRLAALAGINERGQAQ